MRLCQLNFYAEDSRTTDIQLKLPHVTIHVTYKGQASGSQPSLHQTYLDFITHQSKYICGNPLTVKWISAM